MTVYLFTTTDCTGARSSDLTRYMHSLDIQDTPPGSIKAYLLLQNCTPENCERFKAHASNCWRISGVPGQLSLSSARNLMLSEFKANYHPDQDDIIAFPDDDCWLPFGFVPRLATIFDTTPKLGLLVCRMSLHPETEHFGISDVRMARAAEIVRLASSNNMFIRGTLLPTIGNFDINLGLGTPAVGGEDTDFVIRAFLISQYSGLIDRELIGHRKSDETAAAKYYRGALLVLARYACRRPALMREFSRKFVVGLYFIFRRRLSIQEYCSSSIVGLGVFFASLTRI